ncbi:MAG: pyridoxamine 5'-phosphate oxidase family protein, partial [Ruminococcaceae bacterium]|nr:pyridoxamine 5'-phosphate oxidase family protein [Oscillospiraceae bacterium]
MFRPMRRSRQALSREECEKLLREGSSGVLAVTGDEGWPYAVPLSYVWRDGAIYFHCARTGHKLDAIRKDNRVSFCVVGQDRIVPEEYTTYFRSVIVFGRAQIMEDQAEIRAAIEILAEKYHPADTPEHRGHMIDREIAAKISMAAR